MSGSGGLGNYVRGLGSPDDRVNRSVAAYSARVNVKNTYDKRFPQASSLFDTDVGSVADTTTASFDQDRHPETSSGHESDEDEEDGSDKSEEDADPDDDPTVDQDALATTNGKSSSQQLPWNGQYKPERLASPYNARSGIQIPPGLIDNLPIHSYAAKGAIIKNTMSQSAIKLEQLSQQQSHAPTPLKRTASTPAKHHSDTAIQEKYFQAQAKNHRNDRALRERSTSVFAGSELGSEMLTGDGRKTLNGCADLQDGQAAKICKRALELDHSPDELTKMTFQDLADEPFDHDPAQKSAAIPEDIASQSLAEKLQVVSRLPDIGLFGYKDPEDDRRESLCGFFSSLPIDQYDECGDLIVDQFVTIMSRFRDVRRQKRAAAIAFEAEVAKRDEAVQARKESLEEDMNRLRRQGSDVLAGKP